MRMKKQEASYTVELALLMPFFLFALFMPVHAGYRLYAQAKAKSVCGWDASFEVQKAVRRVVFVEDILSR